MKKVIEDAGEINDEIVRTLIIEKGHRRIVIVIIGCLFIKTFIYYIHWDHYSMTYKGTFVQMSISVWIIKTLINWNRVIKENNNFGDFTFILLVSALIIILPKPNITYNKGKGILNNYIHLYRTTLR